MKFPVILRSRWFPPHPFGGISLLGVFVFRSDMRLDDDVVRHETIHFYQQREWLFLPFFVVYVAEFVYHLVRQRNWMRAYRAISFEREAYAHEHDAGYLKRRPLWANYRKSKNRNV